jgi:ParB-like chromosome segregation protein Spo0J
MAEKLNCCVSVLNTFKLELNLPPRERIYRSKEVDWNLFKEMYDAGKTYREIGEAVGLSQNSVLNHRLRLGLPDRDPSLMKLDILKFKEMFLAGDSYEKIASEFHISDRTVQEIRKKLHLRQRQAKPTFTDEEFTEAYESMTYNQLCAKFRISWGTVAKRAKKLGPSRSRKPKQEPPVNSILPKLAKPVDDKPKNCVFIVPTLKQIQKEQLLEEMRRIEKANRTSRRNLEDN